MREGPKWEDTAFPKARWHQRWATRDYKTPATTRRPSPPYTFLMPLDIAAVQASLAAAGLDGWLLYDFHGSNPIAQSLAGLTHAAKMTTRRWYYYIPASGRTARPGPRHRAPQSGWACRARCGRTPAARPWTRGSTRCSPARRASRWSTRPAATSRICRESTPARSSRSGSAASTSSPRATWCSRSRPSGRRPRLRRTTPPPTPCTGSRIGRSRCSAAVAGRPGHHHRIRPPAADGRLVRRRRARQFRPAGRGRHGQCRQSALPADRFVTSADRPRPAGAAGSLGQAVDGRRRLRRHHLGGLHRRRRCPPRWAGPSTRSPGRATRRADRAGGPRRGRGRPAATKWIRAAREVLVPMPAMRT